MPQKPVRPTISPNDYRGKPQSPRQRRLPKRPTPRQRHPHQRVDNHHDFPDTVLSIAAQTLCGEHNQSFKLPCFVHGNAHRTVQIDQVNIEEAHPMIGASKILTVSYGTFSCTLEGFDEPFNTMKAIAEYFRDLAAEDRYFGAEPPTPDAAMLHRIAEREIQRRVEAKIQDNGVILRAADVDAPEADLPSTANATPSVASVAQFDNNGESIAARLSRLRSAQDEFVAPEVAAEPSIRHVSETAAEAYTEDQHADDVSQNTLSQVSAFTVDPQIHASDLNDNFDQIDVNFNHTDSALDELIAAEVVADRPLLTHPVAEFDDAGSDDEDAGLYDTEAALPIDYADDPIPDAQLADLLPEDIAKSAEQDWQTQADDSDEDFMESTENSDLPPPAIQPGGMTPRQQRRFAQHLKAIKDAKSASTHANLTQADLNDEFDDDALLASLSTLDIAAASATEFVAEEDYLLEQTAAEPAQIAELTPISVEPAPVPQPSENIQRARARVIKIRRADTPVADPATAQATVLSAEAEADLEAELASLRAESEPVSPTRPTRPVRNLAVRTPVEPAQDASTEEDDQLTTALASMRLGETDPVLAQVSPQIVENRKRLETESGDAAVSRLMEATNTAMDGVENRRRHAAISHLKAAVAATEADRQIKAANPRKPEPDRQDIYRNDLESVVRPRSVEPRSAEPRPTETRAEARAASNAERPSPLVLVSEQRIDRPKHAPVAPTPSAAVAPRMVLPSRPRRIAANSASATATNLQVNDTLLGNIEDDLDEDDVFDPIEDANYFAPSETFDDFADKLGATTLPELLEASAVYCAQILGRPLFSRTMVMHQVQSLIDAPDHNLEDSLRGFGTLLRQGRLAKIKRGHFAVTDRSPMLAEALRIAG
jgi:hypothetical protein